jgi:hypothetical protein
MRPPIAEAETNIIPRNKRPLPKKTVAKNWSSFSPRRSRKTPRNHRKATPANGMRFNARDTLSELVFSHEPVSRGLTGTDCQNNQRLQMRRREKRIPAMAAARGVFSPG